MTLQFASEPSIRILIDGSGLHFFASLLGGTLYLQVSPCPLVLISFGETASPLDYTAAQGRRNLVVRGRTGAEKCPFLQDNS